MESEWEGRYARKKETEETSLQIDSIWIYSNWMKHDGIRENGTAAVAAGDAASTSVARFIFRRMLDFYSE